MTNCARCGAPNPPENSQCSVCGAPLAGAAPGPGAPPGFGPPPGFGGKPRALPDFMRELVTKRDAT